MLQLQREASFNQFVENINTAPLADQHQTLLFQLFYNMYPISNWGRIDWEQVDQKVTLENNPNLIIPALTKLFHGSFDKSIYVAWFELEIIQTNLDYVIAHFDKILCIALDKFLFNPSAGYIIEIRSDGYITVGIAPISFMRESVRVVLLSELLDKEPLYRTCIEKLSATLLYKEDHHEILTSFKNLFPINADHTISWNQIDQKYTISDPQLIAPTLKPFLPDCYRDIVYVKWSDH